jgi:uncharacterized protein YacL (UPF0231 family)
MSINKIKVMNNQIVLNALNAQLLEKQKIALEHKEQSHIPKNETLRSDILKWFRDNVSSKVPNITASQHSIEISKSQNPNSSWGGCTLSLDIDYKTRNPISVKMNWYGSSARLEDENTLIDVEIFGAVASKLGIISHEFINNWYPAFKNISAKLEELESEIHEINRSISQVESDIRVEGLDSYKKEGFALTLDKNTICERNWTHEDPEYKIRQDNRSIKLSTGRSNYNYVWATSFKILKINKYKVSVEVTQDKGESIEKTTVYEVSAKKFNDFIQEVYNWQNGGSQSAKNSAAKRYKTYSKVEA